VLGLGRGHVDDLAVEESDVDGDADRPDRVMPWPVKPNAAGPTFRS
jgi:hypothetical protein